MSDAGEQLIVKSARFFATAHQGFRFDGLCIRSGYVDSADGARWLSCRSLEAHWASLEHEGQSAFALESDDLVFTICDEPDELEEATLYPIRDASLALGRPAIGRHATLFTGTSRQASMAPDGLWVADGVSLMGRRLYLLPPSHPLRRLDTGVPAPPPPAPLGPRLRLSPLASRALVT